MLKSIDILLGLSVVMLMVSLIVTVLTQAIVNLMQTRGKNLLDGIAGLLRQIHCELPRAGSREIAEALLTHPLIKSAGSRYGTVIHREELTALLLELAVDDGPNRLNERARAQLCDLLKANGIENPKETMDNVRALTLSLEREHPELSNNQRYAMAFLEEARSGFLGKINGWFDQTVDRVSERFTNSTRIITFVGSLAVALILQLDTAALVNRLGADPAFRQALVEEAIKINNENAPRPAAASTAAEPGNLVPALSKTDSQNLQTLSNFDVIAMPTSITDWKGRWSADNWMMKLLGIVLTAMLLSLGAPFWYNALKNLIRLRSLIAQKDDDQRLTRQTSTDVTGSSGSLPGTSTVLPLPVMGERGDLASVG